MKICIYISLLKYFSLSVIRWNSRQIGSCRLRSFYLARVYEAQRFNSWELGNNSKVITVKLRYSDITFSVHRSRYPKIPSYVLSEFTAANHSELTEGIFNPPDMWAVIRVRFPTATAYVVTTLSELLPDVSDLSKCLYQGWWPENCKNPRYVTLLGMEFRKCTWLLTSLLASKLVFKFIHFYSRLPYMQLSSENWINSFV